MYRLWHTACCPLACNSALSQCKIPLQIKFAYPTMQFGANSLTDRHWPCQQTLSRVYQCTRINHVLASCRDHLHVHFARIQGRLPPDVPLVSKAGHLLICQPTRMNCGFFGPHVFSVGIRNEAWKQVCEREKIDKIEGVLLVSNELWHSIFLPRVC